MALGPPAQLLGASAAAASLLRAAKTRAPNAVALLVRIMISLMDQPTTVGGTRATRNVC